MYVRGSLNTAPSRSPSFSAPGVGAFGRFVWVVLSLLLVVAKADAGGEPRVVDVFPATAAQAVRNVRSGDVLQFRAGVYRMNIELPRGCRNIGVRAAQGEHVVVKGSDVVLSVDTEADGQLSFSQPREPSQVFVDGVLLQQMGGTVFDGYPLNPNSTYHRLHGGSGGIWPGRRKEDSSFLPDGAFRYDEARQRVVFRYAKWRHTSVVEMSTRARLFYAEDCTGVRLEGMVFEHSNVSRFGRGAAVTVIGSENTVEAIEVRRTDLVGMIIIGDGNRLARSKFVGNGQLGIAARGKGVSIVDVEASFNNYRGFNKWWEAGGFKFVGHGGLQQSELIRCRAFGNDGDGVWYDWKNVDNKIEGCLIAYNRGFGVHYEASTRGHVLNNIVHSNAQHGIYFSDSSESRIEGNTVMVNGLIGIVAVETGRVDDRGVMFSGRGVGVFGNSVGWNAGGALALFFPRVGDALADDNTYYGEGKHLGFSRGFPSPASPQRYSLKEWQTQSGGDLHSVARVVAVPESVKALTSIRLVISDWQQFIHP